MGIRDFTLSDTIRRNAVLFPDRPAFIAEGRRISHRVHHERVERLAGGLAASGVVAGDRVAVLSQNNLELTELYGAAAWLGAICCRSTGGSASMRSHTCSPTAGRAS